MSWLFSEEWVDSWKQYYAQEKKMNDEEIENEIKAKNLNAPRVTLERIVDILIGETFTLLPSGRTLICEITLLNGYTVRGESSCVSIKNFDMELGKKISREDAIRKVWQLEGYLLKQRLHDTAIKASG